MPAGRRPGMVAVLITSSVRLEPFSEEEMLDPRLKVVIGACERNRLPDCRSRLVPGEPRDQFSQAEHDKVHVYVTLAVVEAGRAYDTRIRWFAPDGGVAARMTQRHVVPRPSLPGLRLTGDFWAEVKKLRPGRWRVEVAVNDEVEAERTFEVIGSTRTDGPRSRLFGRAV
ncbi:MAG TPA: hypothetical protein VIE44_08480 [Methylomirabilota bacterium]